MATTVSAPITLRIRAAYPAGPIDSWAIEQMPVATSMSQYYDLAVAGQDMTAVGMYSAGKDHRYVRRPADGRFYFFHSDQDGGSFQNGGVWSVDPKTRRWRVEYPVGGYPGDVQHVGADSGGWCHDDLRDCFYSAGGNSPFGIGWPGPSTGLTKSDGICKFSFYGGRWHWEQIVTLAQIRAINSDPNFSWGHAQFCYFDRVLDSIWFTDEAGLRRINVKTFIVSKPLLSVVGDSIYSPQLGYTGPMFGAEVAAYGCIDPDLRKIWTQDAEVYWGPNSLREAGVIWEHDIRDPTRVQSRILCYVPVEWRKHVWDQDNGYRGCVWNLFGPQNQLAYLKSRNLLMAWGVPQRFDNLGSYTDESGRPLTRIYGPGERGYVPGTEIASIMVATGHGSHARGTVFEGPPFVHPSKRDGGASAVNVAMRQGVHMIDPEGDQILGGWSNASNPWPAYFVYRPLTFPAWRKAMQTGRICDISTNTIEQAAATGGYPTTGPFLRSGFVFEQTAWGAACLAQEKGTLGAVIGGQCGHGGGGPGALWSLDIETATFKLLSLPTYSIAQGPNWVPPPGVTIYYDPGNPSSYPITNRMPPETSSLTPIHFRNLNNSFLDQFTFTYVNLGAAYRFGDAMVHPHVNGGMRYQDLTVVPSWMGGEAGGTIYAIPQKQTLAFEEPGKRFTRFGLSSEAWIAPLAQAVDQIPNASPTVVRYAVTSTKHRRVFCSGQDGSLIDIDPATNTISARRYGNTSLSRKSYATTAVSNGWTFSLAIGIGFYEGDIRDTSLGLIVCSLDEAMALPVGATVQQYSLVPPTETRPGSFLRVLERYIPQQNPITDNNRSERPEKHLAWSSTHQSFICFCPTNWTNDSQYAMGQPPGNPFVLIKPPGGFENDGTPRWKTSTWKVRAAPITLNAGVPGLRGAHADGQWYGRFQWSDQTDCAILIGSPYLPAQAISFDWSILD